MTARELRQHLEHQHGIVMWGASFDTLLARHDVDHRHGVDIGHVHDHDGEGDS